MNLSDYPTPLTDDRAFDVDTDQFGGIRRDRCEDGTFITAEFARDLERKLARCREFLDALEWGSEVMGNKNIAARCKLVLQQTK